MQSLRCPPRRSGTSGAEALASLDLELRAYFEGAALGYGLLLSNTERLPAPIGLDSLRQFWPGFQPPQSFGYVPFDVSEQLLSIG